MNFLWFQGVFSVQVFFLLPHCWLESTWIYCCFLAEFRISAQQHLIYSEFAVFTSFLYFLLISIIISKFSAFFSVTTLFIFAKIETEIPAAVGKEMTAMNWSHSNGGEVDVKGIYMVKMETENILKHLADIIWSVFWVLCWNF